MSSFEPAASQNRYMIDIESGTETARLVDQDRLFTEAMGGLFPELSEPDLSSVQRILDIACGPGGWAVEVAFAYPDYELVGIDISQNTIEYARAVAWSRGLNNVTFSVMDATKPLAFEDASFDLVNTRLISALMNKTSWPLLLAECQRILRPGGIIRLSEVESGTSNSLAALRLGGCFMQVLAQQGRSFSVDGHSIGLAHVMRRLLQDAGFADIHKRAFLLESSYGMPLYYGLCKDTEVAFALLKPYLVKSGVIAEAEYDELYNRMLIDMLSEDYLGIAFGLTAWGVKPAEKDRRRGR
ncbi:MAG: methyltransferase domain-containing protein [Ktedonobacteraceae bacterium]